MHTFVAQDEHVEPSLTPSRHSGCAQVPASGLPQVFAQ